MKWKWIRWVKRTSINFCHNHSARSIHIISFIRIVPFAHRIRIINGKIGENARASEWAAANRKRFFVMSTSVVLPVCILQRRALPQKVILRYLYSALLYTNRVQLVNTLWDILGTQYSIHSKSPVSTSHGKTFGEVIINNIVWNSNNCQTLNRCLALLLLTLCRVLCRQKGKLYSNSKCYKPVKRAKVFNAKFSNGG